MRAIATYELRPGLVTESEVTGRPQGSPLPDRGRSPPVVSAVHFYVGTATIVMLAMNETASWPRSVFVCTGTISAELLCTPISPYWALEAESQYLKQFRLRIKGLILPFLASYMKPTAARKRGQNVELGPP